MAKRALSVAQGPLIDRGREQQRVQRSWRARARPEAIEVGRPAGVVYGWQQVVAILKSSLCEARHSEIKNSK